MEENKKPQSRFKNGSLFARWESDGEDFINFHSSDEEEQENKAQDEDE